MKIGIMGCGVISKQYIQDIQRLYRELEICMVADVHSDVAERTAQALLNLQKQDYLKC